MSETLYPIFYGTRLVPLQTIIDTFEPNAHPEAFRRLINFLQHHGGRFGVGSGYRAPGKQPDGNPGFAPPGKSFHEGQQFPSGRYYAAWDLVVVNPGHKHRTPKKEEVPLQGQKLSFDYGLHINVGIPGKRGFEPWHIQPVEIDGWGSWVYNGRPEIRANYPIVVNAPRPQPQQPPVPPTQPTTMEIKVEFNSRYLKLGSVGNDVKFFQRQLNEIAGQGLLLDGYYGPKMVESVMNWQRFFNLTVDGELGSKTQQSIIEISLHT